MCKTDKFCKGRNWLKKTRIDFIQSLMVSNSEDSCVDLAYNGILEHMKKYSDIICMNPSPTTIFSLKKERLGSPLFCHDHERILHGNDETLGYGNMGCEVSKGGIQNKMHFWTKIKIPKGKRCILSMNVELSCQKVQKSDFQSQCFTSKMI